MKEVTRVHIAKSSYDIEIEAKKGLEDYIHKLEIYANDQDILQDIEIRITELLGERGVAPGGVISVQDVAAIRGQLGEPQDFAIDDDLAATGSPKDEEADSPNKRLYRDSEGAIVGGVLSGLAKYLGVNALWVRLVFIVVLLGSFGSAIIAYVVLWLAVPVAKTAAQKLESEGKPVTLASIRRAGVVNDQEVVSQTPRIVKNVVLFCCGILSLLLAVGAIAITVGALSSIVFVDNGQIMPTALDGYEWVNWLSLSLLTLSGLLLCSLGVILAYASFSRSFSRRIGIATLTIVITGIVSFVGGVTTVVAGTHYESRDIERLTKDEKVSLGSEFSKVRKLVASSHSVGDDHRGRDEMTIEYMVDPGEPRYVLTSLPGVRVDVNIQDEQARITLKSSVAQNRAFGRSIPPRLVIYGPALSELDVQQGELTYTSAYAGQEDILINSLADTVTTVYGDYGTLSARGSGTLDLESSTVRDLMVEHHGGSVSSGVVRTLGVKQSDVCPAHDRLQTNKVVVKGVSSGKFIYNGEEGPAHTIIGDCGMVVLGGSINEQMGEQ